MAVREFAAHLGVSDRMVSKWGAAGRLIRPREVNQAVLDESLRRCTDEERQRFDGSQRSHVHTDDEIRLILQISLPTRDVERISELVGLANAVLGCALDTPVTAAGIGR
jgi:hypothetical protein